MDQSMLTSMREVEEAHWWFVARRRLLMAVVGRYLPQGATRLLDIGSGTGANLEAMRRHFTSLQTVGLDANQFCREACAARGLDVRDGTATSLPVETASQDIVTLFDVLEHIDDEAASLSEIARVLRPGGILVLTVPAYQWLWGPHDVLAHHRRRYTRTQLLRLLEPSCLQTLYASYFNTLLFPLAVVARFVERASRRQTDEQSVPARPVNATLRTVFLFERIALTNSVTLPWGLSVLVVAWKR
jgi:ubiquinone/menaquinone biosynthesis C-methylase UbiE